MSECHPDRATLEKFLDDEMTSQESLALQRHLFLCSACEEHLVELLPLPEDEESAGAEILSFAPPAPTGYHRLIRQILADAEPEIEQRRSFLARERAEAQGLWQEVEPLEAEAAGRLVAGEPRFHTWGFFELVVDEARRSVLVEPRRSEEQFRLALVVTDHLDPALYSAGQVEAARARACGYLGNAWRVLSDFRRAEQAFLEAERHLLLSWADPLDEALLLELEGSLRRAQHRFDEALALLDGAMTLYREINEPHLQGRTLMTKGLVLQYTGDYRGAIACFRDSLFLLDGAEDPRLVVACQFNLINCLFDSGRTMEAAGLITDARRLMEREGTRSDLLRLRWLEARTLATLGQVSEAEQALLEVRDAFTRDRIAFDAALVSLHLAALYAREGRTAEAQRMAREMIPIFQSCEVHQEALAALIVLQKAAEMEQLTLGLVEEVSAFLERVRANPANAGLRFRASELA